MAKLCTYSSLSIAADNVFTKLVAVAGNGFLTAIPLT